MNILVTGANGQLGNEMRIVSRNTNDRYIFTDVNQVESLETTYLDITDLDAIRTMVKEYDINAIVNCAAWTNVDGAEDPKKYALVEKLNATAPENLAIAMKEVGWCRSLPIMSSVKSHTILLATQIKQELLREYMEQLSSLANRRSSLPAASTSLSVRLGSILSSARTSVRSCSILPQQNLLSK